MGADQPFIPPKKEFRIQYLYIMYLQARNSSSKSKAMNASSYNISLIEQLMESFRQPIHYQQQESEFQWARQIPQMF